MSLPTICRRVTRVVTARAWPPAPLRLASSTPAPTSAAALEAAFHARADATLDALEAALEDAPGCEAFDLTHASGVFTLRVGDKGTFVLNKQAPNRQIWWSSPVTGPRRYAWDAASSRWLNTRDASCLARDLEADLFTLTGKRITIDLT